MDNICCLHSPAKKINERKIQLQNIGVCKKAYYARLAPIFDECDNVQARVLAGSLFDGKVSLYRYTLISEQEQEAYKDLVKDVINQVLLNNSICDKL